jgi:hypothetical protein
MRRKGLEKVDSEKNVQVADLNKRLSGCISKVQRDRVECESMKIDVDNLSSRNGYLLEMQRQANSKKENLCNDNVDLKNKKHAAELRLN